MATIEEPTEITEELHGALGRLLGQLSSSSPPPSRSDLEGILASPATRLLVACDDVGAVVGTLTLVVFRIPTGVRAWIEDVVVDQSARGHGHGRALTERALELAARSGAKTVELTSRPSRQAANRLYRRLGFVARETNVYRYDHRPA